MSAVRELSTRDRAIRFGACLFTTLVIILIPAPGSVEPEGWRLFGIFAGVIVGLLLQPFPMATMVVLGLIGSVLTRSITFDEAVAGYGKSVVWLVVGAFLLAGAVRETGLGRRIALQLVSWLGRSTMGLGYAQAAAELVLGPIVPSNTARGGGILAPISRSLSGAMGSEPHGSAEKAGTYLTLVGAHANLITAAMFLTGMAANSVFADQALKVYDVEFGWGTWALGSIVPGLLSLALLPLLLFHLVQPTVRDGRPAQAKARAELAEMGPWSRGELVMAGVFVLMIALWSTSFLTGLGTAFVAWIGVSILLVTGTRRWEEMARDHAAWDALIWLGGLLTLATGLANLGIVAWFADTVRELVAGFGVLPTVLLVAIVYFYSMYAFSMLTAHITAMGGAFLAVCFAAEVPALLAVPLLAYFSNLCACTTLYSTGPVIIYYGLGYVSAPTWFRVGFVVSLFHFLVWIPAGLLWWKLLGWW